MSLQLMQVLLSVFLTVPRVERFGCTWPALKFLPRGNVYQQSHATLATDDLSRRYVVYSGAGTCPDPNL
ncbi:MAG: hypothetical protein U1E76_03335 [Planctomycetota bacterium]